MVSLSARCIVGNVKGRVEVIGARKLWRCCFSSISHARKSHGETSGKKETTGEENESTDEDGTVTL